jgi:hypothetical protein
MYFNQKKISPIILFIVVTLFIGIILFIIKLVTDNDDLVGVWNGVSIYSNNDYSTNHNNDNLNNNSNSNSNSNSNYYNGIYTGIKWQCVEFARRYLIVTHGITFSDVTSAFQIPDAKFTTLDGKKNIEVRNDLQVGSLIVCPKNYMANSVDGHVAVVSSITPNGITVVEQNYNNKNEINRFISRDDMRNTTILTVE